MEKSSIVHTFSLNRYALWTGLLLILFITLGFFHDTLTRFDFMVMKQVWLLRSDLLNNFFIFMTYVGSAFVSIPLLIVLGTYFLVNKKIKLSLVLVFNLIGVRAMNRFLKKGYNRARPDENPLLDVSGLSFPSGHAMNSAAFIGFLGYLLWTYLRKKGKQAGYALMATWTLVFLIGFSRVYLGVHFPSDVIAGFAAGGIWLILTIVFLKGLTDKRENDTGG
ncbi:phosphatase PAP2 family protein [Pseudalkalibacillus salsuginis]|uniref:phosphatase PAP2 family protein n=1 Tax=Pseudalkalibacillus salsuginis TaxID=2910972 RepID=UPI001F441932|nr:phosphatase PAP2 family protein [Pseudalkalibacillus salsuginis]MCF6408862.1 phosphatase PAP2 family protein [Pseudalkalibacillus salsuginis]